jgi:hypothetical protein
MKIRTKRNLLRIAAATAIVCTAAVILIPAAASATPASTLDFSLSPVSAVISSIPVR